MDTHTHAQHGSASRERSQIIQEAVFSWSSLTFEGHVLGSCALGFTTSFPGYKEWIKEYPSWPPHVEEKTLMPRIPDFLAITNV